MFKVGDYVIYHRSVCKITDVRNNKASGVKSYILSPTMDETLTIVVPFDTDKLRALLTKKEVQEIINDIPKIDAIDTTNKMLENDYKELLRSEKPRDLIKIIKTAYLRNQERIDSKRVVGQKDKEYFNKAEEYLYNEFSYVLGLSYDDTKKYVVEMVDKEKSK